MSKYNKTKEWLEDIGKGHKPKVHWYMERWKKRVQCQPHSTKYMLPFEEYDIPVEDKCKHCHQQWLKMKTIYDKLKPYTFYMWVSTEIFICDIKLYGFNRFSIDLLYRANPPNGYIGYDFNRKITTISIEEEFKLIDTVVPKKEMIEFWKLYYKINRI